MLVVSQRKQKRHRKGKAGKGRSDVLPLIHQRPQNAPDRLDRLFAFAPNYSPSGTKDTTLSPVFTSYVQRAASIYAQINPHPSEYNSTVNLIRGMWSTLPQWDQNTFANVTREMGSRVWIVDGDYDEAVEVSGQGLACVLFRVLTLFS